MKSVRLLILVAPVLLLFTTLAGSEKSAAPSKIDTLLVWPPPPATARIKWVGELQNEFDIGAKKKTKFLDKLTGKPKESLTLYRPLSVAVDDAGVLYVGDMLNGVVAMDRAGRRMWLFSKVSGRTFREPVGIAVDSKIVYVCDSRTNTVALFDKQGNYLTGLGSGDGINHPVGIAVDESRDLLIVVNTGEHSIRLYNRALKLIKKIGGRGTQEASLNFPTYVCIVPGTGFAVSDSGNFRVQIFDYNGRFIRAFGNPGDVTGHFARPKGIAVDPDNNLYVVDAVFSNFQVFQLDGQVLTFVGQGGTGKGMFNLPSGIAIGKEGTIYVADQLNARIDVLQYMRSGGEKQEKN